ncbi:hypothetical protein QTP88_003028 [Uroleucon formosanum]
MVTATIIDCDPIECLATGFRFSVTHDDPPFGQSEPHDECGKSTSDETLLLQHQQQSENNCSEKPVMCDYLSPYAFTARNSLGSTSDYTRRRRPITLKIVPRLSLPCRSTSAPTTTDADWPFTRKLIRLLKDINAQYHTHQLHSEKSLRIVVKNLHPTTPVDEIAAAIEEIGHSVKTVANIKRYQTKSPLPMFFVDLNPHESDNNIFSITALLHTKVKIEESHKKREITQCLNCQSYGHTRTYCAYPPKCVKCGDSHPTSSCIKPPELPAKCALCSGPHPANYKGCLIFKQLRQKRPIFSSKTPNILSKTTNISSSNSQPPQPPNTTSNLGHHSQLNENSSEHPRTYANAAKVFFHFNLKHMIFWILLFFMLANVFKIRFGAPEKEATSWYMLYSVSIYSIVYP